MYFHSLSQEIFSVSSLLRVLSNLNLSFGDIFTIIDI